MFTIENYPRSSGSIEREDYRLQDYLNCSILKLILLEFQLLRFCRSRLREVRPRTVYDGFRFIQSGFEWSTFLVDATTVVKIPNGIFPEVESPEYLMNAQRAYETVRRYFPEKYIARSEFARAGSMNTIRQEYIKGKLCSRIGFMEKNKVLLKNLQDFYRHALVILRDCEWIPDVNIRLRPTGFRLRRNLFIEEGTFVPRLIDFTVYIDIFRLYPVRKKIALVLDRLLIRMLLLWLRLRLG